MSATTRRSAVLGFGLGVTPGLVFGAWAVVQNPWFLDRPELFFGVVVLLPGAVMCELVHLVWRSEFARERVGWEALLLLLPVQLALLVALWPQPEPDPVKLLVYGVDGATWDLIDPMAAQGELPTFAAMQAEGSRATLMSMEPMFSPLLWTTMATGKPPEQHGVRGFSTRSHDVQVPRFWDIAEQENELAVGIYKWLVSYPPRPVNGFMVPAWLAPAPHTWPAELSFVKELELSNRLKRKKVASRRAGWELALAGIPRGLRLSTLVEAALWKVRERRERPDDDARFLALQMLRLRIDRDVFVHALHRYQPELATFTLYATDALAHRFWTFHEPEAFADVDPQDLALYGEAVRGAYREADAILGELRERLAPGATVVVLSDHGFRAYDSTVDIPPFQPLTERLSARLSAEVAGLNVVRLGFKVVLTMEDAAGLPELEAALVALTDAEGQPVYRWEPVPDAPGSIGLTFVDERITAERLQTETVGGEPLSDYARLAEAFSGEHDPEGVFLAVGPEIPASSTLQRMQLLDVAPTLQALSGVQPAQDLPGEVVLGDPARGPLSRDDLVERLSVGEGQDGVDTEMLRALGYIE